MNYTDKTLASSATSYKLQISHILLFTLAVAFVLAVSTFGIPAETHRQLIANLKPPIVVWAVADIVAKGFSLCGLTLLAGTGNNQHRRISQPLEYYWLLLGGLTLLKLFSQHLTYVPVGLFFGLAAGLLAWFVREPRWKVFYIFVAVSPFVISTMVGARFVASPTDLFFLVVIKDVAISLALVICMYGTSPSLAAFGAIVAQFSLTAVSILALLLMYLDLWK